MDREAARAEAVQVKGVAAVGGEGAEGGRALSSSEALTTADQILELLTTRSKGVSTSSELLPQAFASAVRGASHGRYRVRFS